MMFRRVTGFLFSGLICFLGLALFSSFLYMSNLAHGLNEDIILKDPGSFLDNSGHNNIIGVIDNNGKFPVDVTVAINVTDKSQGIPSQASSSGSDETAVRTVTSPTFARIIYPGTGAPFKIVLDNKLVEAISPPFVYGVRHVDKINYDLLKLNYSNMAMGSERALIGTMENTAPFPLYNTTVYASVHDTNKAQIDSVISDQVPVLQPGEKAQFKLIPDAMAMSNAVYYSCAGFSLTAPINTFKTSNGGFIPFDLQALAKIVNLRYDDASKSVVFGIDHYNPDGGFITLKLPQMSDDQKLTVIMDGLPDDDVKMTSDGKTIKIDIFIPPDEHQIEVNGVTYTA
jgi:hypothetical protein